MQKIFITVLLTFVIHFAKAQQTVGLFTYDSLTVEGYTLFGPKNSTITYLIDNCGRVVHTWTGDGTPPAESIYLLENGRLLKTGKVDGSFNGAGVGGRISLFDWNGGFNWTYEYLGDDFQPHHDVEPLPNGNILAIVWERRPNLSALALGRDPSISSGDVWSEKIVEIKPIDSSEAEIVWEWTLWDHLVQDFDSTKANYGIVADHPELLDINFGAANQDWIHFNGIDYNAELDQILLCSRNMNEIYIIDHSTTTAEAASHSGGNSGKGGDFLYRWGNPQVYDRGSEDDKRLFGPHDARWIEEGALDENKIMIFNNGFNRPGDDYSTVEVIDPPINDDNTYSIYDNEAFKPDDLFWIYEADPLMALSSPTRSGAQRLSNGNTLITEGRRGNFYEVTYDGEIVWHYKMPIGLGGIATQGNNVLNPDVFRATRYEIDYPAFEGKDLTPGDPIELNPLPSDCVIFGTPVSNQNIEKLEGVDVNYIPSREYIVVKNQLNETLDLEVIDLMGRRQGEVLAIPNADIEISTSSWDNGIYFVRVFLKKSNKFLVKKIIKTN